MAAIRIRENYTVSDNQLTHSFANYKGYCPKKCV